MRTLLSERFAPITAEVGFLELPLEEAAAGLEEWRRSLHPDRSLRIERPTEGFPEMLHRLEPLTAPGIPRELLVGAGKWTAYLNNALHGTDAEPKIGYLSEALGCQGVVVRTTPHIPDDREGSVQFLLFGPLRTDWLNYVRSVGVACEGGSWEFFASGTEQPFEEPEAYRARRVRDRFTSHMLERYCQALGIEVFNPGAYGPEGVFFEKTLSPSKPPRTMTLEEVQSYLGIVPGMADELPG